MKNFILLLFLFFSVISFAQEEDDFDYQNEISSTQVDTLDWNQYETIQLSDVKAYSLKLNTKLEKKYYLWLEKRVDDVYPFLEKAVSEYYQVKDSAKTFEKKREQKRYIKKRYKELAEQYEDKLKKLTTSRGQILCKLIHRETHKTAYDMIKELRGGLNAFMWNAAGGAFSIDLKETFDTKKTREDLFIEVIIQRGIASGKYNDITEPEERKEKINPVLKAFGRK